MGGLWPCINLAASNYNLHSSELDLANNNNHSCGDRKNYWLETELQKQVPFKNTRMVLNELYALKSVEIYNRNILRTAGIIYHVHRYAKNFVDMEHFWQGCIHNSSELLSTLCLIRSFHALVPNLFCRLTHISCKLAFLVLLLILLEK